MNRIARVFLTAPAITVLWSAVALAGTATDDEGLVTLWTRKTGSFVDDQNPDKLHPKSVRLSALKLQQRQIYDAQYGRAEIYQALPLEALVNLYKPQAHDDMLLLHFANGMTVPLPRDFPALKPARFFVALKICDRSGKTCRANFPEISKEDAYLVTSDPRPITFGWNKFVSTTAQHPDVPALRARIFSPWRHADTLTGIEFVNRRAYYRQFDFGEPAGESVFRERCQFCHSVRYVGASFGWDFVTPLPIYEKHNGPQLLNHVKYPKNYALRMGLMMPAQNDVSETEIQALWRWLKKAAQKPQMHTYQP